DTQGTHVGEVRVTGDNFDADNSYFFTVDVLPKIRVLLVNGEASDDWFDDEGYWFGLAVSSAAESPFVLERIEPAALSAASLRQNDVAVLLNVGNLSNGQADAITAYVQSGGSLLLAPGDRVVTVLPNSIEFVISCFAVWKARAIIVPEYNAISPANLQHVLMDSQPSVLIIDHHVAEQLEAMPGALGDVRAVFVKELTFAFSGFENLSVESLDAVLESGELDGRALPTGASAEEIVSISYTSGSTGIPKGVMHTHASTLAAATFTKDHAGISAVDTIVIPLPLHHGLAFRQIFAYLLANATVAIAADIYQALKLLREQRPTALLLVPAAVNIVLNHFSSVLEEADADLRYVEVGSAAIAPERLQHLRKLLPTTRIYLPYGLTEARVAFLDRGSDGLLNHLATVSPGLEAGVVDAEGRPVTPGQTGEIVLKGRGLMVGYWGQSKREREKLTTQGFRTGDMGQLTSDGKVELLGRIDDLYKVGGRKVHPLEVEMAISQHRDVVEAAVTGVPDPKGIFEIELHAFVVARKGSKVTETELLAHCRTQIEPYKLPARIHFRNSLPKSAVGKVLRQELAAQRVAV
ncbi:MAG: acyl--CoA ligase, partial [Planctomycetes bacterium]|nr:acyl--CoA ligase [Planctomycetota bacterium]